MKWSLQRTDNDIFTISEPKIISELKNTMVTDLCFANVTKFVSYETEYSVYILYSKTLFKDSLLG